MYKHWPEKYEILHVAKNIKMRSLHTYQVGKTYFKTLVLAGASERM